MRAVRIEQFGPVAGLVVGETHNAAPRLGEGVVQVKAAGVNVSDVKNVHGMMKQTVLPRIPGRDFAGIVVQGPRNYHGMEVWGSGGDLGFTRDGTHAQHVSIPIAALKPKPRKLTFEQAAAVGVPAVTAVTALKHALLKPDKTLLVIGAAGAVGSMAVQVAKWKGSHVIGAVRSAEDAEVAKGFGADTTIVIGMQDLAKTAKEITHGQGAEVVLNTAGPDMVEPALGCLAMGGRLVVISASEGQRVSFEMLDFYRRDLRIIGQNTLNMDVLNSTAALHELSPGFDSGAIRPPDVKTISLDHAVAAYMEVEEGTSERIVLIPG